MIYRVLMLISIYIVIPAGGSVRAMREPESDGSLIVNVLFASALGFRSTTS